MHQKNLSVDSFKKNFLILILLLYSFLINQYFGYIGVFPTDSFAFFDRAYGILLGEYPFQDYWTVSGITIDFLQSIIFFLFGVSWTSYLLHSSLLNLIFVYFNFKFFEKLNLNFLSNYFLCLCIATLSYSFSGSPFVDHHAVFLSIIGLYLIIWFTQTGQKNYLFLGVFCFVLAFFSKQVPTTYIILVTFMYLFLFFYQKSFEGLYNFLILTFIYLIVILSLISFVLFFLLKINFSDFWIQYISHPISIGENRFNNINFSLDNLFLSYKFFHFFNLILLYFCIKNNLNKKYNNLNLINFTILALSIFLLFHQIVTKNQIFIYFILFIVSGLILVNNQNSKGSFKYSLLIFFIFLNVGLTIKYHYRYNIDRKFLDFNNFNQQNLLKGSAIDNHLKGLKWITPDISSMAANTDRVNQIKLTRDYLLKNNNVMLISNYSFFSVINQKKTHSPVRYVVFDNTSFPLGNSKFSNNFKEFLIKNIKRKNVESILAFGSNDNKFVEEYLTDDCYLIYRLNDNIINYKLNFNCDSLKN